MANVRNRYVIDAGALIDLKENYPREVFAGIWDSVENLISKGTLRSCHEVLKEVSEGDDDLAEWAQKHKRVFRRPSPDQLKKIAEILIKYQPLIDYDKDGAQADPFVIAMALEKDPQRTLIDVEIKTIVVCQERLKGNKIRVPYVCKQYGLECVDLIEMFKRENWKFVLAGEKNDN